MRVVWFARVAWRRRSILVTIVVLSFAVAPAVSAARAPTRTTRAALGLAVAAPFAVDLNFEPEIRVLTEQGRRYDPSVGRYVARTKTLNLFPLLVFALIVGAVLWLISEMRS